MKRVFYTAEAAAQLGHYRSVAARLRSKLDRYARTGAGDVTVLVGQADKKRLRVGDFRIVFEEGATDIVVTRIGPRGSVYED